MGPIVRVQNLSKQYRLGMRESAYNYGTLRESIVEAMRYPLRRLRGNGKRDPETIWALQGVNFEVAPGEVIGIIGRNGAGKSTLLKVLSRITEPTLGRAELYGRVASLLEVGTGFHPELTGRENIFLNGAILGMRKAEIIRRFDEIVAFAELEKFLDTPVKWYSSGMYMRLAFAVASHLEPEILIVDEVLAVGDVAFQKKCLGKMQNVAQEGRTVLFVSHNMAAVRSLTPRTIWMDQGQIIKQGNTDQVILSYLQKGSDSVLEQVWENPAKAPGNERVRLHSARLRTVPPGDEQAISIDTPFQLEFEFWNYASGAMLNFTLHLYTIEGIYVLATSSRVGSRPSGLIKEIVQIPPNFLNDGIYNVTIQAVEDASSLWKYPQVLTFEVHENAHEGGYWFGKWPGVVRPRLAWESSQPN